MKKYQSVEQIIEENELKHHNLYYYKFGGGNNTIVYYSEGYSNPAFIDIFDNTQFIMLHSIVSRNYEIEISQIYLLEPDGEEKQDINKMLELQYVKIKDRYTKLRKLADEQSEEIDRLQLVCALIPNFKRKKDEYKIDPDLDDGSIDEVIDDDSL